MQEEGAERVGGNGIGFGKEEGCVAELRVGALEGIGKGAKPAVEGDPSSVCSAADDVGRGRRVGGRRKCTYARVMLQHHW